MRAALPAGGCGSSSAAMLFHCSMVADELLRQLSILVGGFLCRHCLARRTAAAVAPPVTPLVTDRRVYWWEGVGGGGGGGAGRILRRTDGREGGGH